MDVLPGDFYVVVSPQGQEAVLQQLHEGHTGMTKMKQLARAFVLWPNNAVEIEKSVSLCHSSKKHRRVPKYYSKLEHMIIVIKRRQVASCRLNS